jgi:hypothetical protein
MSRRLRTYPKRREVAFVLRCLQSHIPVDKPPEMFWRRSERGTPNLRVCATTNRTDWLVDIYSRRYIVAQVGSLDFENFTSVPSLVSYLYRWLRLDRS